MTSPLLKVTGLKKAYGAIKAVDGVSFEVMPGEIFGVIGPNGSGKTTMFNSVLGQIEPDAGAIELKGKDITGLSPQQLNQQGVGRTFQTLQVFGKMTVRDNLIVAAQEHQGSMWSRMFAPGDSGLGAKADALIDQFRSNMRAAGVEKVYTLVDWTDLGLLNFFAHAGFNPSQRLSLEFQVR